MPMLPRDRSTKVESLMKGHHLRSSLPRFPGKKSKLWTNHGDLAFVEDRRKSLEQYLKILLQVTRSLPGSRGDTPCCRVP